MQVTAPGRQFSRMKLLRATSCKPALIHLPLPRRRQQNALLVFGVVELVGLTVSRHIAHWCRRRVAGDVLQRRGGGG